MITRRQAYFSAALLMAVAVTMFSRIQPKPLSGPGSPYTGRITFIESEEYPTNITVEPEGYEHGQKIGETDLYLRWLEHIPPFVYVRRRGVMVPYGFGFATDHHKEFTEAYELWDRLSYVIDTRPQSWGLKNVMYFTVEDEDGGAIESRARHLVRMPSADMDNIGVLWLHKYGNLWEIASDTPYRLPLFAIQIMSDGFDTYRGFPTNGEIIKLHRK